MINTRGVTTLLTTVLILFLLAGCGNSTDEEAEATAVPPTTESAVEPTAVPAQSTGWSDNPVRVTNLGGDQAIPRIMPGDNGGFYVAWFSNPPGRENYDVRMQRYDAQGNAQWEENGRILSDNKSNTWISDYVFTKDNDGNLILAFQDMRTGSSNLYAYKFSPDGKPLWGENGLPMTDNEGFVGPYPTTVSTPEHITLIWGQETDDSFK
ncbi:MAG: hypothetical protein HF973_06060 [Chloroflexi bacterium]|nr:hypothetical protein [Chloroflexota bacterium]